MSREHLKIVTIGGGSSYTPELVEGFIKRYQDLPVKEWWLVDIEEGKEKQEIVGALAKRMIEKAGVPIDLHLTLNRREALKDADFVTTQFRVGLMEARIKDERISLSHGLIGQETNGAGGIFKAFRTINVMKDVIADMRELCPNAWLINFANPAGMVAEAVIKHFGWKKAIGICNNPVNGMIHENALYGLEKFDHTLFYKYAGLNHFHWHRVWDKNGKEITDDIIDELYSPETRQLHQRRLEENFYQYEQIKNTHLLPNAYLRYYYITDDMLKMELEEYKKHETRAEVVKRTEDHLFELYKDPNLNVKPKELENRGGTHYSDAACTVIDSIWNDKRKHMVVSTQNNGAIVDLPYDCIVEVSCIITAHGPEPLNWGSFPTSVRGMVQLQKAMEECVVKAAITGDYATALQAFTINPLIPSGQIARDVLNELLLAHEKHLPQFKEAIAQIKKGEL